jgi:two-component system, OmpR family, response regulator
MRILVTDDEERLVAGLRTGLEAEGFAVDVALDGVDGLWLAREQPHDAIVLDIMLPGLNGYRVCRQLRQDGIWTPILMLTAKDGDWDQVEALGTGADDYLTKPFSNAVLVARLRALLWRGARERPTILTAGDLRLTRPPAERGGAKPRSSSRPVRCRCWSS